MAFSWDSVEVRGADGLLQLGKVINCADGGLIVDFQCKTQAPHFFPFGQIYRSSRPIILHKERYEYSEYWSSSSRKKSFEALVREGPGEPWKWHQADLLTGGYEESFGLISVKLAHCSLKGIVSGYRIRIPAPDKKAQRLLVKQGDFRSHFTNKSATISIPREHSAFADAEELHWNGNADAGLRVMSWFDQNSTRVKAINVIETDHWGSSCAVTFGILVCRAKGTIPVMPLADLMENPPSIRDALGSGDSETTGESFKIADYTEDDGKVRFLPIYILAEVFQFLNTVEQSEMRRVCAAWNSVLILPEFSHVVRVSFGGESDDATNAACVYKNWKHHKVIIIADSGSLRPTRNQPSRMASAFKLLKYINKSMAGPLQTLIVANSCWEIEVEEWTDRFQVIMNAFRKQLMFLSGICQKLILRNVTITLTPWINPDDSGDMYTEQPILYRDSDVIVHVISGKPTAGWYREQLTAEDGQEDDEDQEEDDEDEENNEEDGQADVGGMSASDWWAKFDDGLPRLTPADMKRVKAWIGDIIQWEHAEHRQWEVAFLLNMMQSGDPRGSVAYRGKHWYRDLRDKEDDEEVDARVAYALPLDHLDVSTLSRLTQHSLLNRLDNQPYRLRVKLSL